MAGRRFAVLLLSFLVVGCGPLIEGPQLEEVPEELGYTNAMSSARLIFRERPKVSQVAYVDALVETPRGTIIITEVAGPTTRQEVVAAWEANRERWKYLDYEPIEDLEIDGRPAWGWFEVQRHRETETVERCAVVSYEDVTYTIEFHARHGNWLDRDFMRGVVSSFAVKHASTTTPWVVAFFLVVIGGLIHLGRKASRAPRREH